MERINDVSFVIRGLTESIFTEQRILFKLIEFLGVPETFPKLSLLNRRLASSFQQPMHGGCDELWRTLYSIEFTRASYPDH